MGWQPAASLLQPQCFLSLGWPARTHGEESEAQEHPEPPSSMVRPQEAEISQSRKPAEPPPPAFRPWFPGKSRASPTPRRPDRALSVLSTCLRNKPERSEVAEGTGLRAGPGGERQGGQGMGSATAALGCRGSRPSLVPSCFSKAGHCVLVPCPRIGSQRT